MGDLAQQFDSNTIDEPVIETILRDVRLVRFHLIMNISEATEEVESNFQYVLLYQFCSCRWLEGCSWLWFLVLILYVYEHLSP